MHFTIGCLGRARHGKGTISTCLKTWFQNQGVPAQIIAFADPLKDFLTMFVGRAEPFRGNDAQRNAPITEVNWEDLEPNVIEAASRLGMIDGATAMHPSGRQLMQLFGTEVIRAKFCRNAWVRMAGGRAKMFDGVTIVEDVRFPNEAVNTQFGGIMDCVIKVTRPGQQLIDHPSENAVDEVPLSDIDVSLINNGSVEDLNDRLVEYIAQYWKERCSQAAP